MKTALASLLLLVASLALAQERREVTTRLPRGTPHDMLPPGHVDTFAGGVIVRQHGEHVVVALGHEQIEDLFILHVTGDGPLPFFEDGAAVELEFWHEGMVLTKADRSVAYIFALTDAKNNHHMFPDTKLFAGSWGDSIVHTARAFGQPLTAEGFDRVLSNESKHAMRPPGPIIQPGPGGSGGGCAPSCSISDTHGGSCSAACISPQCASCTLVSGQVICGCV